MNGSAASFEWDNSEVSLDELFDAFRGLLVAHTFSDKSFEKEITERAGEYEVEN